MSIHTVGLIFANPSQGTIYQFAKRHAIIVMDPNAMIVRVIHAKQGRIRAYVALSKHFAQKLVVFAE